jgi:hypothetical protein
VIRKELNTHSNVVAGVVQDFATGGMIINNSNFLCIVCANSLCYLNYSFFLFSSFSSFYFLIEFLYTDMGIESKPKHQ